MMDIGKAVERGLWLTALLATLSTVRHPPPSKPSSRQPAWRA